MAIIEMWWNHVFSGYYLLKLRRDIPRDVAAQENGVDKKELNGAHGEEKHSCFLQLRNIKDMTAVKLILHCLMHLIFILSVPFVGFLPPLLLILELI